MAVLGGAGFHAVAAPTATGAPAQARELHPDLVLCDIAMPDLDGYGVLRELQADPATAGIPVVFLTARREVTERVRAFRHGVVDYILKPIAPDALVAKVQRVLESLQRRSGLVRESGRGAADLVSDLQREHRTGVITAKRAGTEPVRTLITRGEIEKADAPAVHTAEIVEFEELDPPPQAVHRDPPAMPGASDLPRLDALPEGMRLVLVADDNALFRNFIVEMLAMQGLRAIQAVDGADALRIALEKKPWLILSDVRMAGTDGLELCRQVRRHALLRHTPFIFLSGWDDYGDRYEGLQAGANEFVSKQTGVRELLLRVQLVMKRFADLQDRDRRGAAMQGRVAAVGAPAVIQMCHLAGLSGVLTVRDGERRVVIGFQEGRVVFADSDDASGDEAVYGMLGWTRGSFDFQPADDPGEGTPVEKDVEWLLIEGCRLLDEAQARS